MENHELYASNTTFQKRKSRLWTFTYPNGGKAQLDYIIARKKWSKSITNVNAYTQTFSTLQSDHRPLIAQVQLKLRSAKQAPAKNPRPNFKLLNGNHELQHQYAIAVKNRFEILAETETINCDNYHHLETACMEAGKSLLPRTKPDRWNNIAHKPSVKQARNELHQVAKSGNRREIKAAKKNLEGAYKQEEINPFC